MKAPPREPRVSVMVLTRNRLDVLRTCVMSILGQRFQDMELVVLDDASDMDDTAATIAREFADSRIRAFRAKVPFGVAGGRNFLMEQSRGEILVSIDDDAVFVGDHALDEAWSAFERCTETAAVAFRVTNVVHGVRRLNVPFSRRALSRQPVLAVRPSRVAYYVGAGHAVRKRFIQAHGGYRGDMIFGAEELDLAYRIIQNGYCITYEPAIEVDHFPMPSVVGEACKRQSTELFYYMRNRAYLAYRYLPWRYAIPYLGIWTLRYALDSLRNNNLSDFIWGVVAPPRFLRGVEREVLDRAALTYLMKHGGRLWY